jgi:phosphonate transport system substrate-binding protein
MFMAIFLAFFLQFTYAKQTCLQYGVIPYSDIALIEKSYTQWKQYLERNLQRCIDISFESSYGDIVSKFIKGELDMAFVGPFSYILIKEKVAVEPLVSGITADGESTYKSYMVASKKIANALNIVTPYQGEAGMKVLKKKLSKYKKKWTLAFTDESSTSGYAIPSYYMKKAQLNPDKYFREIAFVGTHDAVQLAIRNNITPIGFGASIHYKKLLNNKKISKDSNVLLWKSDDIPKSLIIVQKNFPQEFKKQLQRLLIEIPPSSIPKISKEVGYIQADELKYDIVEKIYRYIN